jgi:lipoprotein-anchoring transpeptidase ErfK/SrfK
VLSRFALSSLCTALVLAASTFHAQVLVAQSAVRRPTVPVIPVARVVPRDGGRPAASGAAKPPAKAPARGAGAAKPEAKATRAAAKPAAKPARDTGVTLADATVPVAAAAGGEVVPAARAAGYARYRSRRDSVAGETARAAVDRARGLRIAVSLETRELAVLDGADTLLVAPVAIGMDTVLRYGARTWTFDTPRGKRVVRRKDENPVWVPPEWHYAEVANRKGFKLAHLPEGRAGVALGGGRRLVVRNGLAGVVEGGAFTALPTDEEIVFGKTLYIPPTGTKNRRIEGELGRFRLDLGDGYQLHGTPHEDTIGDAATHGCIRLYDEDVEWLFQHVPLGTPVYIF